MTKKRDKPLTMMNEIFQFVNKWAILFYLPGHVCRLEQVIWQKKDNQTAVLLRNGVTMPQDQY